MTSALNGSFRISATVARHVRERAVSLLAVPVAAIAIAVAVVVIAVAAVVPTSITIAVVAVAVVVIAVVEVVIAVIVPPAARLRDLGLGGDRMQR
jgi:uncharacterized membrane-anchored protein